MGTWFFDDLDFDIRCTSLTPPGWLFPSDDCSDYDVNKVLPNVLYYVNERNGLNTHPLADLFFRTNNDELVLIDVSGGNKKACQEKKQKLAKWIQKEQANIPGLVLHGVVLAPSVRGQSLSDPRTGVAVMRKIGAKYLPGGLAQLSMFE